ncbi:class I SAM-dependent methyltransferase [Metabacillus indicus]|uniref:class I SAM-dependent methyltransferase n=1 Tax=Metabacillus indicus TaxID=246786 RepID=UPI000493945A|nr:class I SAM-dependent methyltransferase [Metabacillus indicus]KEZ50619.1 ubiquinone biosynthesis methyltransferase UbiE [Metabacillus indicus LMG 22858]
MPNKTKEAFDRLARIYETETDSLYNTDYERPAMVANIPENLNGSSILDAGCSAGWYSDQLLKRGAHVTGVDISPNMIEAAIRKTGGRAKMICHDLSETLPFADASFDGIVSSLTLHYCKDWRPVLSEFSRVLKPSGWLLFSTHHPFMDWKLFECKNYFSEELLHDTWKKSGQTFDVSFYRKPLEKIVTETSRFFSIDKLIEPKPAESLYEKHPANYEYLTNNPHFIMIRATARS